MKTKEKWHGWGGFVCRESFRESEKVPKRLSALGGLQRLGEGDEGGKKEEILGKYGDFG